jgi:hypothetical protein
MNSSGTPKRDVERVLGHRHQLDVRVPHLPDVRNEVVREFPVGEVRPPFGVLPLPRPEVDLVDGERGVEDVYPGAFREPRGVPPRVPVDRAYDRPGARRHLEPEGEGVRLQQQFAGPAGADLVLVDLLLGHAGEEDLPDAGFAAGAHRVHAAVPVVRVAHHRHPLRVGRPDGECRSPDSVDRDDVAAELLVLVEVAPLGQEVDVEVGEYRAEGVRVVLLPAVPIPVGELQPVREDLPVLRELRLEEAVGVDAGHRGAPDGAAFIAQDVGLPRPGLDRPHGDECLSVFLHEMRPQDGKRVPVTGVHEQVDVLFPERGVHRS